MYCRKIYYHRCQKSRTNDARSIVTRTTVVDSCTSSKCITTTTVTIYKQVIPWSSVLSYKHHMTICTGDRSCCVVSFESHSIPWIDVNMQSSRQPHKFIVRAPPCTAAPTQQICKMWNVKWWFAIAALASTRRRYMTSWKSGRNHTVFCELVLENAENWDDTVR